MDIDGLSYRQWQRRNTDAFKQLSKEQQQTARDQGYYNVSWKRVQASWLILQTLAAPLPVPTLFDAKLKKGDVAGAIDQSLLAADQAQTAAQEGQQKLRHQRQQIKEKAEAAIHKYQLL